MDKLLTDYTNSTTLHGVPGLVKSKGFLKKITWAVVIIGCLCGCIYNFYAITSTFIGYPVYVRVEKLHSTEMVFPAVTVCNTNPIKKSAVHRSPRLQTLLASWGIDTTQKKRRRKRVATCTNIEPTTQTCYWVTSGSYAKSDAYAACQADGGQMAVLNTKTKFDYVINNLIITNDAAWLDLEYSTSSDEWLWKGTTSTTWTGWVWPGTPATSTSTGNPCVYLIPSLKAWLASSCAGKFSLTGSTPIPSLCESPHTLDTITTAAPTTAATTTLPTPIATTEFIAVTTEEPTVHIPDTTSEFYQTSAGNSESYTSTTKDLDQTTANKHETYAESTRAEEQTTTVVYGVTSSETIAETTTNDYTTETSTNRTEKYGTIPQTVTTAGGAVMFSTKAEVVSEVSTGSGKYIFNSVYPERDPYRDDFLQENDLINLMATLSLEDKKELGYVFPEFILNCAFQGTECFEWQFNYFFDAVHGSCYMFNSGWNATERYFTTSHSGSRFGLQLLLNIRQEEYVTGIGNTAGVVVVVREQNKMTFPEDEGVFAPPGMSTSIAVKKVRVSRLGGNYGNCTDEHENSATNVFAAHYPVKYTVNACEKTCYQRHVITTCGCGDPQYPMTGDAVGSNFTLPCDLRNQTQDDCVYGLTQKYIQNELTCDCKNPCTDEFYTYTASRVLWPTDKEENNLNRDYSSHINSSINSAEYLRNNLLKIEVYFDDLNYDSMAELPKYLLTRYISDIGATFGLWIGCSILTITELFELMAQMTVTLCLKICRKSRSKKQLQCSVNSDANLSSKSRRTSPHFTGLPESLNNRRISNESQQQTPGALTSRRISTVSQQKIPGDFTNRRNSRVSPEQIPEVFNQRRVSQQHILGDLSKRRISRVVPQQNDA